MDSRAFIFQSSLYMFETGGQAGQDLTVRLVCQQLGGGQEDAYLNNICLPELCFRWTMDKIRREKKRDKLSETR